MIVVKHTFLNKLTIFIHSSLLPSIGIACCSNCENEIQLAEYFLAVEYKLKWAFVFAGVPEDCSHFNTGLVLRISIS